MKKLVLLTMVAALVVPAMADVTLSFKDMGAGVRDTSYYGTGVYAVELIFDDVTGLPGGSLNSDGTLTTFCLERGERLDNSTPFTYTATLEDTIAYNGNPGSDPIPLLDETAWLYDQYRKGYDFGITDVDLRAAAVQDAIWYGQHSYVSNTPDGLYEDNNSSDIWQMAQTEVTDWTNNKYKVLRMIASDGSHAQDVIVAVPVPGAFLLGGLGVACVGWIKRRRTL